MKSLLPILLASALLAPAALAKEGSHQDKQEEAKSAPAGEPKVFTSEHKGRFNGVSLSYKVIAGETYLKNDKDEPVASIFSTSYLRQGVDAESQRPVTFIFNGGPGSASLWLHMGVFGPRRIDLPSDAHDDGAPPYDIVNNDLSPLDATDLVFIDPVGTGYSRALGKGEGKDYWGVAEDADSIAKFIRIWITEHKRWNAPKYIAGESYGTTRAAALTDRLQGGFNGIAVNGVILISSILDFSADMFQTGNQLPYLSYLPTYAATHWYHHLRGKSDVTLEQHVERARTFALNDYASYLMKGDRASDQETARVKKELSALTGLSEKYLDETNMRIQAFRFMKQFGRAEGYTVGRFDTRYKGKDFDDAGEFFDNDPSGYAIASGYTSALNHYFSTELKVDMPREYKVLTSDPGRNWKWQIDGDSPYANLNVAPMLGQAMRENKDLRILQLNGYFDLATPFFGTENTFATNGFVKDRVTMAYFPAGHMMYLNHPSLERMAKDIHAFISAGRPAK